MVISPPWSTRAGDVRPWRKPGRRSEMVAVLSREPASPGPNPEGPDGDQALRGARMEGLLRAPVVPASSGESPRPPARRRARLSWRLVTLAGIDVRIHVTFLL